MFDAMISKCPKLLYMFSGKPNSMEPPPDNDTFFQWYFELPFTARLVIYIIFLGTIMTIIFLILKFISEYDMEDDTERLPLVAVVEEEEEEGVSPVWPQLNNESSEVTGKGVLETMSFSSSEDLDYSTLCVICFEERRNCFFVPCGHSATCRGCAQRILSEESKVCPICRRLIRKSKRLVLRP